MPLLVDIGNSRTKYIDSNHHNDNVVSVIDNSLLSYNWLEQNFNCESGIVFASVQQEISQLITRWAKQQGINTYQVCTTHEAFGITCAYANPTQLGVDRWLAIIGATAIYPKSNILVVDTGTATTFDLVDQNGVHHGGWIIPGLELMVDSLNKQTSRISVQFKADQSLAFGSNTEEGVNQGSINTTLAAITSAVELAKENDILVEQIILTGGNAKNIIKVANMPLVHEEQLIFYGLKQFLVNL